MSRPALLWALLFAAEGMAGFVAGFVVAGYVL